MSIRLFLNSPSPVGRGLRRLAALAASRSWVRGCALSLAPNPSPTPPNSLTLVRLHILSQRERGFNTLGKAHTRHHRRRGPDAEHSLVALGEAGSFQRRARPSNSGNKPTAR